MRLTSSGRQVRDPANIHILGYGGLQTNEATHHSLIRARPLPYPALIQRLR